MAIKASSAIFAPIVAGWLLDFTAITIWSGSLSLIRTRRTAMPKNEMLMQGKEYQTGC